MINNESTEKKEGFEIDLKHFPSKDYQRVFAKVYFENLLGVDGYKKEGMEGKLDDICNGMMLGCLLSHMQWGLWGVAESARNDPDWDYLEYGRQRLFYYYETKRQYLNDKPE